MENEHIVGKFDDELNRIKSEILENNPKYRKTTYSHSYCYSFFCNHPQPYSKYQKRHCYLAGKRKK